jgi:dihydrodipicolinate synthase/N-acetylneuraminate lyase
MGNPLKPEIHTALKEGLVIPAHPLALNASRKLDEERQRGLTKYYMAAGAGGVAVGVHTTQFEIRDAKYNLYQKVLELAIDEVKKAKLERPFVTIAGICGDTVQALGEARLAKELGYDMGLVSMGGLSGWSEHELINRMEAITQIISVFGFYLQPSVGGRILSYDFWKAVAEIPGVMAIKMAPFNRYQTLDVVRAVAHSSRSEEIALYTGNDENIINDLLTTYHFMVDGNKVSKRIVGGLLGQWAVWTKKAVELLQEIKQVREDDNPKHVLELLSRNVEMTDVNAALFDPSHDFAGCIPGIHEILRRQGILEGRWCLNPNEELSPGQLEEIDRVYRDYPHLNDDDFVSNNRTNWFHHKTVN